MILRQGPSESRDHFTAETILTKALLTYKWKIPILSLATPGHWEGKWYKNSSPRPHFLHVVLSKRPICTFCFSVQWPVNILVAAIGPLSSLSKTLHRRSLSTSHQVQQPMLVCLSLHHSLISSLSAHGETAILYRSDRKLGGSQSQSRHCEGEEISWLCWELNPYSSVVQPVV
jgi:hypothetical protein